MKSFESVRNLAKFLGERRLAPPTANLVANLLIVAEHTDGAPATADVFLFEGFRLDRRGLFRRDKNGAFIPIAIGSRALEVLHTLVERPGELVSRDEMLATVWPGTVVEGSNLPVQIAALRRVLDQGRADGSSIQTSLAAVTALWLG